MTHTGYIFHKFSGLIIILVIALNACGSGIDQASYSENPQSIPYIKDIVPDGNSSDWPDSYRAVRLLSDISGEAPDTADLQARFRLAWNENGLFILAEIQDDFIFEDPERFWNGDGMEIFISPMIGSFDIVQLSLRPAFNMEDSRVSMNIYDHRQSDSLKSISPVSVFFGSKSSGSYSLEGMIPLNMLGFSESSLGMEMALQLYINDADRADDTANFSLPWFPVRDSYRNPYAFHKIHFSASGVPSMPFEARAIIKDDQFLHIRVLSDRPFNNRELGIQAGKPERWFGSSPIKNGLCVQEWNLPLNKLASEKDDLRFFRYDSVFLDINLILLQRIYEDIPEPNRFEKEIRIFEIIDHFNPPPPDVTLFTGSSTIRKWTNLHKDLPGLELINRGFGGSTMADLNYYAERIVLPYLPSKIIIYEGDNDIARGSSPAQFIKECTEFIQFCQQQLPAAEVYFMSIKPSPSRIKDWNEMQAANRLLEELTERYENVYYIDISAGLLDASGGPFEDLFEEDRLHLNEKGYRILSNVLKSNINK